MKKNRKKATNYSGIALLLCFIISGIGVAIALRQLALERRLFKDNIFQKSSETTGIYTTKIARGTPEELNITMTLGLDNSAHINRVSKTGDQQIYTGTWSSDSNGTIILMINKNIFALSPTQEKSLRLLNPDNIIWATTSATLVRQN